MEATIKKETLGQGIKRRATDGGKLQKRKRKKVDFIEEVEKDQTKTQTQTQTRVTQAQGSIQEGFQKGKNKPVRTRSGLFLFRT